IASSTGTNFNFIGSQTSTGPAPVINWTANPYWNGQMYQTNPSKGATPTGYVEICVPIKPKWGKKGSGGSGGVATGSGGQWLFWQPVLYGPEGNVFFGVGQWIWLPGGWHQPMSVLCFILRCLQ